MPEAWKREVLKDLMGHLTSIWQSLNLTYMDEKTLLTEISKLVKSTNDVASARSTMNGNLAWIERKVKLYDEEFDISGGKSPNKGSKKLKLDETLEPLSVRNS